MASYFPHPRSISRNNSARLPSNNSNNNNNNSLLSSTPRVEELAQAKTALENATLEREGLVSRIRELEGELRGLKNGGSRARGSDEANNVRDDGEGDGEGQRGRSGRPRSDVVG